MAFKFSKLYIPLFEKSNGIHLDLVPGRGTYSSQAGGNSPFLNDVHVYESSLRLCLHDVVRAPFHLFSAF